MKPVAVRGELLLATLMLVSTTLGAAVGMGPQGAIERDGQSGSSRLVAHGPPVKFEVDRVCRYDPKLNRWSRETMAPISKIVGAGVIAELPHGVGLYWVQWKENGRPFASLAVSGPVLCNDIHLAPSSRTDVIAACVPQRQSAQAAYVPDPNIGCER